MVRGGPATRATPPIPTTASTSATASRRLAVRAGDRVLADTEPPLMLYESGLPPRSYVRRADVVADALTPVEAPTFFPYKGIASHNDIGGPARRRSPTAHRSTRWPRISELLSFEPDRVEVTLDGERVELEPRQSVVAHGLDRDPSIDEAGGLRAVAA